MLLLMFFILFKIEHTAPHCTDDHGNTKNVQYNDHKDHEKQSDNMKIYL